MMRVERHNAPLAAAGDSDVQALPVVLTRAAPAATATAVAGTLALAGACWAIAVWQMNGMDMGPATQLGSFGFFIAVWIAMMAAMMLPGAVPAAVSRAQAGGVRAVPAFVASYLAVWGVVGLAVYAVYRPHGSVAAGTVVVAAGLYELSPIKKKFRQRCLQRARSGLAFGLCCAGSTIGLMAMLAAVGVMSITWMAVVAVVVLAQKLLPVRAAVDVPLALAITGFGVLIILAPALVPVLTPPMM
jgi:predicted metal-binding membrane protein